jgi:hypothetical protein
MDEGATEQASTKLQELQLLHCTVPEVWIWLDGCHQFAARRRFWNQKSTKIWFQMHRYFQQNMSHCPYWEKNGDDVYLKKMECFKVLDQPLSIYSAAEGPLNSKKLQTLFMVEGITHVITKTHANQAERMICTIKKNWG